MITLHNACKANRVSVRLPKTKLLLAVLWELQTNNVIHTFTNLDTSLYVFFRRLNNKSVIKDIIIMSNSLDPMKVNKQELRELILKEDVVVFTSGNFSEQNIRCKGKALTNTYLDNTEDVGGIVLCIIRLYV